MKVSLATAGLLTAFGIRLFKIWFLPLHSDPFYLGPKRSSYKPEETCDILECTMMVLCLSVFTPSVFLS